MRDSFVVETPDGYEVRDSTGRYYWDVRVSDWLTGMWQATEIRVRDGYVRRVVIEGFRRGEYSVHYQAVSTPRSRKRDRLYARARHEIGVAMVAVQSAFLRMIQTHNAEDGAEWDFADADLRATLRYWHSRSVMLYPGDITK